MRIAFIVNTLTESYGIQKIVCLISKELANENDITVFCQKSNVHINNIKVVELGKTRFPYIFDQIIFHHRLKKTILLSEFDIIHSHEFAFEKSDVITIHSCHRLGVKYNRQRNLARFFIFHKAKWLLKYLKTFISSFDFYTNYLSKKFWHLGNNIIVVSNSLLIDMTRYYGKRSKKNTVYICDNPIPINISGKIKNKSKSKSLSFLCISNRLFEKNVEFLVKSFIEFNKKFNVLHQLTIVGGNDKEIIEVQSLFPNQLDNISFVGHLEDPENYYLNSDIFVLLSEYESFGLVFIEAMSYGLPVIIKANLPLSDLVNSNNAGWIINDIRSDIDIQKVLSVAVKTSADEFKLKSQNALKLSKNYNITKVTNTHISIYSNILNNR